MRVMWLSTFDKARTSLPMSLMSHSKHKVELDLNSNLTGIKCSDPPHRPWCLNKKYAAWPESLGLRLDAECSWHTCVCRPCSSHRAENIPRGTLGFFCFLGLCVHRCFVLPLYMAPLYLSELTLPRVDSDFCYNVLAHFPPASSRLLALPCLLLLCIAMDLSCASPFPLCFFNSFYSWPSLLVLLYPYLVAQATHDKRDTGNPSWGMSWAKLRKQKWAFLC